MTFAPEALLDVQDADAAGKRLKDKMGPNVCMNDEDRQFALDAWMEAARSMIGNEECAGGAEMIPWSAVQSDYALVKNALLKQRAVVTCVAPCVLYNAWMVVVIHECPVVQDSHRRPLISYWAFPSSAATNSDGTEMQGFCLQRGTKSTTVGIPVDGEMGIRAAFEFIWNGTAYSPMTQERLKPLLQGVDDAMKDEGRKEAMLWPGGVQQSDALATSDIGRLGFGLADVKKASQAAGAAFRVRMAANGLLKNVPALQDACTIQMCVALAAEVASCSGGPLNLLDKDTWTDASDEGAAAGDSALGIRLREFCTLMAADWIALTSDACTALWADAPRAIRDHAATQEGAVEHDEWVREAIKELENLLGVVG
eukprot:CAMPEP_0173405442 /NCGR_PEP_ID=MMETSP1356-20130122/61856_1 /TAXON_ID=77927 ORGANISM="Hemiselmis virescens, Strain PCC157" /NCGR_SAMPLE_ID=MMETSP1356 /ASSEMBLY_ACC=CAM_ASM_000847 /LENGTH=368 /DNA_ID=CAMNT_0014366251 /DNA_START=1 /DNA_END=1107 /DNA_ORIENTATION=+